MPTITGLPGVGLMVLKMLWFVSLCCLLAQEDSEVWEMTDSGVDASLRGLCVVNEKTVWASGTESTVIRTNDAGATWKNVSVTAAEQLDFRDIHAFDDQRALVLSAGQPARVYGTSGGGENWRMCFEHQDEKAFFDAMSFSGRKYAIAMSDPVGGRILLIESDDAGQTWKELPATRRPRAMPGEAGFAASGTNMRVNGKRILIALGGAEEKQNHQSSRIVFSDDRGKAWMVATVPMPRSPSAGIFSMHFVDGQNGVVVGGDYLKPGQATGNCAITTDGGKSWQQPKGSMPTGYRSGVAHFMDKSGVTLISVGTNGTDASSDRGHHWSKVSELGFHAIAFTNDARHGWAVGSEGRVAKWAR